MALTILRVFLPGMIKGVKKLIEEEPAGRKALQKISNFFKPRDSMDGIEDVKLAEVVDFMNRHQSLELLLVNMTSKKLIYKGEYFESGGLFTPVERPIKPGDADMMLVASIKDSEDSPGTGVTGGLTFEIEGEDKYIHIGFKNTKTEGYKTYITVTKDQKEPKFGYDNAEDDTDKSDDLEGYRVQCTMQPPKLSPDKMFQYIVFEL